MKLNELTPTEKRTREKRIDDATRVLVHYLRLSNPKWDSDNTAEVRDLVELLMEGV